MSVWEISMLVAKGRLKLSMDVSDWIAKSESLPFLSFVPVNNRIAIQSVQLPQPFHSDPADRIIVATTQVLGASLISKDEKIRNYSNIKSIW